MKWFILIAIMYVVLGTSCIVYPDTTTNIKAKEFKIVAIHSYSYDHPCTAPQLIGLKKYLLSIETESSNSANRAEYPTPIRFSLVNYYMDTKTKNTTIPQMEDQADKAMELVRRIHPDLVVTTDDDAFRYAGLPLSNSYRVVYSGINKTFKDYKPLAKEMPIKFNNLSGTEETMNVKGVMNIINNSSTYFSTIYIITDGLNNMSTTSRYEYDQFVSYAKAAGYNGNIERVPVNTDMELKQKLLELNNKDTGIIFLSIQRVYNVEDKSILTKDDISTLVTQYNTKHLELVLNPSFVSRQGISMSCGVRFEDMGTTMGKIIKSYIINKKLPGNVVATYPKIIVNSRRMNTLGFGTLLNTAIKKIDVIY